MFNAFFAAMNNIVSLVMSQQQVTMSAIGDIVNLFFALMNGGGYGVGKG